MAYAWLDNFLKQNQTTPTNSVSAQPRFTPAPQPQHGFDLGQFGHNLLSGAIPLAKNILNFVGSQPIINNPTPFKMNLPTIGQTVPPIWQTPLRAAMSIKQTPILKDIAPGGTLMNPPKTFQPTTPLEKAAFGNQPVKSLDTQVKEGKNIPFVGNVKGAAALPLVAAGTALDLMPLTGGAEENAMKQAVQYAKTFKTAEEFAKAAETATPEVKNVLHGLYQDASNPINTAADFFNTVHTGQLPNGVQTDTAKLLGQGNPEQRVTEAIKTMTPLRAQQEAAYTAERAKRIEQATQAEQAAGGGVAGVKAKLSALSGEMPKVTHESIASQVSQADKDFLMNKIAQSTALDNFEKIPAQKALLNLFNETGAKIPTESELAKLRKVFNPALVDELLKHRTMAEKVNSLATDIVGVPRALQSSADFSGALRQGIVPAFAHPRDFSRSVRHMFGYAFSQDKYDNLYKEIAARPTFKKMQDAGLQLTDIGNHSTNEEAFMSNLAEKIPVVGRLVKASDRAYTGFLNNLRADLFDTIYKTGETAGKGNDAHFLRSTAKFVNTVTGRGDLGKTASEAAPILNAAFFSPRLIASRLNLMSPRYYLSLDPTVRKEAAKTMTSFVVGGLSILGALKLAGAQVETDPTSSDFGKARFGNTRYDIWGGFQPYATFIARMIFNHQKSTTSGKTYQFGQGYKPTTRYSTALKFIEGKASPPLSFAIDAMRGQDFEGNKFDLTNKDPFTNPVTKRFIPLFFNDVTDALKQYGPMGAIISLPGLFGVGQQIYGAKPVKNDTLNTYTRPIGTQTPTDYGSLPH